MARPLQGGPADSGEVLEDRWSLDDRHRAAQPDRSSLGIQRPESPRRGAREGDAGASVEGVPRERQPAARGDAVDRLDPGGDLPAQVSLMPDLEARRVIELGYGGNERLVMNMGPQHPSAHGVFRMILTLEGETIAALDSVIGYLHRCHEKLGETLTYAQYPSIASKTDYVAAMTSELTYVMAAERIGKIEVPKRAQYLRVLVAELQRIASHCLWLGTWCLDMGGALGGGATVFLYRVRMQEFRESIRIVRQVLDGLPEGPISSKPALKSVGQVRIPKGETYARLEGPRGEVGCYLIADGGPKPYRMKWRGASFSNLAILPHIVPGHKVADVVAIMGSVDPVFGEVDR